MGGAEALGSVRILANGSSSLGLRCSISKSTSDCLNPARRKSNAIAKQNASNALNAASTPFLGALPRLVHVQLGGLGRITADRAGAVELKQVFHPRSKC